MKQLFFSFLFVSGLIFHTQLSAQSIVNSAGSSTNVQGFIVEYNVGEMSLVQSYSFTGGLLTQGYLQSFSAGIVPLDLTIHSDVSPNGDGLGNEVFTIDNITGYPNNEVKIFDRWGSLIFEMKNYNNAERAFSGKANTGLLIDTKEVADGTYFYVVKIYNAPLPPATRVYNGFLVIKRK